MLIGKRKRIIVKECSEQNGLLNSKELKEYC